MFLSTENINEVIGVLWQKSSKVLFSFKKIIFGDECMNINNLEFLVGEKIH